MGSTLKGTFLTYHKNAAARAAIKTSEVNTRHFQFFDLFQKTEMAHMIYCNFRTENIPVEIHF